MNNLFNRNDTVFHKKTGTEYLIIYTPSQCCIEKDAVPSYVYLDVFKEKIWVRPKVEMEDGRFVRLETTEGKPM